jgi:predicted nuclease of restriction endonuclease-like (RecB) superfamily
MKKQVESQFLEVIKLIQESRLNAYKAVNTELIDLYWRVGEYISQRIANEEWGKSIVSSLAVYIQTAEPELKGFSDKNLWRMKQFFETYKEHPKLSALLRENTWTNNLSIFSRCRSIEEKEFYLAICAKELYSSRELERQMNSGVFERVMIGNQKLSSVMRELKPDISHAFKDTYVFEFLNLPEVHSEGELQHALIGNSDFFIDLVFYHRSLQCLIAFELKADKFKPEHLGQLNFYLEALDRDVKKPHENPSIGILLCKNKDSEVVEYALSRNLSPAMVAEYQTILPEKKALQRRFHEIFEKETSTNQKE